MSSAHAAVMDSAQSDSDDTAFLPATAGPGPAVRKRQRSVGDMIRRLDQKKQRFVSPKGKEQVSKDTDLLEEFKVMMKVCVEEGNERLWQKVENKISSYENRMDRLEAEIFMRDQRIDQLESELRACHESMERHEEQLDDIERHSRAVNLVLSCQRFGRRRDGEDISGMAVKAINDNVKDVRVTKDDFSAVHRLSKENTVICAFLNKNLRNKVYEGRLSMRYQADFADRLFVTENLTRAKSAVFNRLLQLKRSGRVWTVFSKAGIPCFKASKTAAPVRVYNMQQVISAERGLPPAPSGAGRPRAAAPGPLPPPPPPLRDLAGGRPARPDLARGEALQRRGERGGEGGPRHADVTAAGTSAGSADAAAPLPSAPAGFAAGAEPMLVGGSQVASSSRRPVELGASAPSMPAREPDGAPTSAAMDSADVSVARPAAPSSSGAAVAGDSTSAGQAEGSYSGGAGRGTADTLSEPAG